MSEQAPNKEAADTVPPVAPTHPEPTADAPEPPPRGVRTMAAVRWGIIVLSAVAAIWAWSSYARGQQHGSSSTSAIAKAQKYRCPMHHQYVSDEPGECPICHMTLVPFDDSTPEASPSAGGTMSHVMSDGAAMDMPMPREKPDGAVMDMPMSHVMADGAVMDMQMPAMPAASPIAGTLPPNAAPVTLSFDRVQSIGVRTAVAEERTDDAPLRVTAVVSAPEQGVSEVHVRTPGFVERISVRETGIKIGAGQELFGIYSPEAYQAESELVVAKGFGDAGAGSVDATRRRLDLLGVPTRTIDDVVRSGAPVRAFSVSAPAGGFVTKKNVVLGSYVTPEMTLYEIVDLSHVYVVADVFQRDAASVTLGSTATFTPSGTLARSYTAKVDLVYPQIDPQARTTRVRLQIGNDELDLRPGQYGTVGIPRRARAAIVVPRDAVVDTGKVAYVFVDDGNGKYTPRVVVLGAEVGDSIEIAAGVAAGERVVSSATFLVDAESRLRASLASAGSSEAPSPCDGDFDRAKFPDKWGACRQCEQQHRGMGDMVQDCKNAIPKPWR